MRDIIIVPSNSWGGKGILGCKLSMGDEFLIPHKHMNNKHKTKSLFTFKNNKAQYSQSMSDIIILHRCCKFEEGSLGSTS